MAISALLLAVAVAIGVVTIADVGGLATTVRQRLEAMPLLGDTYKFLPPWTFRAFGVWCIAFGLGQFIFVYITVHGVP